MRNYKRVVGSKKKRYGDYTNQSLANAVKAVNDGVTLRNAAKTYNIPKSTLSRKVRGKQLKHAGGQTSLTAVEEEQIVNHLVAVSDWGFPFSKLDIRFVVKSYLDMSNRMITKFKNNLPGEDWATSFIKRHTKRIRPRLCQNIKTSRSEMKKDEFVKYFDNLKDVVKEVPADNILNYDETNLADDPGQEKLIFKRGKKYPERVMNYTKGNTSIMFCGELLPVYVVYKAVNMWSTWTIGGPKYARYNRSKSGWFESLSFNDWFRTVVLPWAGKKEGKKVVIGGNLSSHFAPDIIRLCEENNISFVCLVPNSTHLTQPLDVAFYGPLKRKWRKILKLWKMNNPNLTSLPKNEFPRLLKELVESLNTDNLKAGFEACGIHPLNPGMVLKKLPQSSEDASINISTAVIEQLQKMRNPIQEKPTPRRKQIVVEPGKSVSLDDLTPDKDDASEHDSEEVPDSDISHSEEALIDDLSDEENMLTCMEDLQPLEHNDVNIGQWVKVVYEEELFVGKVLKKAGGETLVQCLEKPFGIREPQCLERENDSVYYRDVYQADVTPQLKKVGRCWKYNY